MSKIDKPGINSILTVWDIRCFLGLEKPFGLSSEALVRKRWEWMQRYRLWEANRKVFLYPENWIEPNLRDNKSPFFTELESELLQKDVSPQMVKDALTSYVYKLDEVANMRVVGLYYDEEAGKIHIFARTRNTPYVYFYRYFETEDSYWYPWEKIQVDIPTHEIEGKGEEEGKTLGDGTYLIPVVWNERLFIFIPQFMKKTKPHDTGDDSFAELSNKSVTQTKPREFWEIKMAWSEYRNGKWTQKQISKDAIYYGPLAEINTTMSYVMTIRIFGTTFRLSRVEFPFEDVQSELSRELADTIVSNFVSLPPINLFKFTVWTESDKIVTRIYYSDKQKDIPFEMEVDSSVFLPILIRHINNLSGINLGALVAAIFGISPNEGNAKIEGQVHVSPESRVGSFEFGSRGLKIGTGSISNDGLELPNNFHYKITYSFGGINYDSLSELIDSNPSEYADHLISGGSIAEFNNKIPSIAIINSLQTDEAGLLYPSGQLQFEDTNTEVIFHFNEEDEARDAFHGFSDDLMSQLVSPRLEPLFKLFADNLSEVAKDEAFGEYSKDSGKSYHELKRAYSIYNWELCFHIPMFLANHLSQSQQFEQATKWYHFVLDPFTDEDGANTSRFWQFLPFKETNSSDYLKNLFSSLAPNQPNGEITEWRDNPFNPHLIARKRPSAYMKWVVMKYLENLINWADSLFRQHTIETINEATQLYILAGHILGPKPQTIPKRGRTKPQTYNSLLDKWDPFGNAMIELELAFPFSSQTPFLIGSMSGEIGSINGKIDLSNVDVGFANVFGFAKSLYFCIPDNPKLKEYWTTVDDRLTKIRSCLDIEGVYRLPALFEPPIDPALLVQATAAGLSLSSVLNDLNAPMPNYRFNYLMQKALELCGELKSLGNALLSALEKKDAEAISKLRSRHESGIQNLVLEARKLQLDEAKQSLDSLDENRKSPEHRLKYYLRLIGEDLEQVPDGDTEFSEIANNLGEVISESGLKLIPFEKEEMDKANAAADWQIAIGVVETIAGIASLVPNYGAKGMPFGIGADGTFGGSNISGGIGAIARFLQTIAGHLSHESSSAGRKGGFQRQLQDRVLQANNAGYEIKQIDKQIIGQKIRINIAEQEMTNQEQQIENASEVEEFLKSKYTNEELYMWMEGSIKTLYYQTYKLAYDLAKKAEKAFQFDRGLTTSNFIQFGYWDSAHSGLLAGERLYLGLKQLESAFQEERSHDFEITKHISLRQTNPLALLSLKETGKCEFSLPEVLFDMDFPGHYKRRIKSVALSIPCVIGPNTTINCTARLLGHKYRWNAIASSKADYLEKTDQDDESFRTTNIPIKSIAVSSGQNDSGVFELNFQDQRYMPFEGAGVISKWRLELPDKFRQFNYDTINDVIIHMRYTADDGGDKLKSPAEGTVDDYIRSVEELSTDQGLFAIFDLKHDFPNEWHKANDVPDGTTPRVMMLNNLVERLPIFAQGRSPEGVVAKDITLVTSADSTAAGFTMRADNDPKNYNFSAPDDTGDSKFLTIRVQDQEGQPVEIQITNWQLTMDAQKEIDRIWLVVRYILK